MRAILAGCRDRQAVIDAFQNHATGETAGDKQPSPGILLGSVRLLCKGFTCTRSDTVVLFEPQLSRNDEAQAYGRVSRIGQRHPVTFGYRLIDSTQQSELNIILRHAARKQLQSGATEGMQRDYTHLKGGDAVGEIGCMENPITEEAM